MIRDYLKLTRFPLVFTAVADSVAGYWIASPTPDVSRMVALGSASACFYSAGMVFNDVADADRDRTLHPQRPIPAGRVHRRSALAFGSILSAMGLVCVTLVSLKTLLAAVGLLFSILLYDFVFKNVASLGPLAMGTCRFANFSLGMASAFPGFDWVPPSLLFVYVVTLTLISTLEEKPSRWGCAVLGVLLGVVSMTPILLEGAPIPPMGWILGSGLGLFLIGQVVWTLNDLTRERILSLVRWGVLSIIPFDALLVCLAGHGLAAVGVLALLLPSLGGLAIYRRV